MKSVMKEYAGAALALVGSICVLSNVARFFLGSESFFAIFIRQIAEGGL